MQTTCSRAQKIDVKIRAIYISPGHNFRGRHGQEPNEHPAIDLDSVLCVAHQGLEGDRYFGYDVDYKGQITFFDAAVYRSLCDSLGIHDKSPSLLRRNVITDGIDLNTLIGKTFEIQGVQFEGTEECTPCSWMDRVIGRGTKAALRNRGGLRARILSTGVLFVSDFVESPPS